MNLPTYKIIHARSSAAIAQFCREFRMADILNDHLCWDECRTKNVSPGLALVALIVNILVQRTPLSRVEKFYERLDVEQLFGQGIQASDFNDDLLARALDKFADADLITLYHKITWETFTKLGLPLDKIHLDTTSFSLHGMYDPEDTDLKLVKGHSKDFRPDLNQIKYGIGSVQGLPLLGHVMDGNTSDKTWNKEYPIKMKDLLESEAFRSVITIADSALVTEENLKVYKNRFFISRLPETFQLCKVLKDKAFSLQNWQTCGPFSEKKESAKYRIQPFEEELYEQTYRFVVVHSSTLHRQKEKTIEKQITQEKGRMEKTAQKWTQQVFHCNQDAQAILVKIQKELQGSFHRLSLDVVEEKTIQRKRGRPKKDLSLEEVTEKIVYHVHIEIQPDEEKIQIHKDRASTFVLISSVPYGRMADPVDLLKNYKEQYQVEQLFRTLKQPWFVDCIYLKKPKRILALGYILLLALFLGAIMQQRVRQGIRSENHPLKIGGQKVWSPILRTILEELDSIDVLLVFDPHQNKFVRQIEIDEQNERILKWLGYSSTIYTYPLIE